MIIIIIMFKTFEILKSQYRFILLKKEDTNIKILFRLLMISL